ncbi:UBP-type zinc finger domain-containing protein [Mycobacterium sp. ACS4331]|uniref:UBP-type zinc finger domain-containing protein n=1 Tax=Mycobacterium sp. ACS4331 TaxID=1834121 RepID=UPI000800E90F|nr:UBP-type zinc finger domain-containing protein [Mycobacterium sp. ACS4331]OBF13003.1 hypothetical protein A5727_01590 [Mycobacterium sp. ACS4331]
MRLTRRSSAPVDDGATGCSHLRAARGITEPVPGPHVCQECAADGVTTWAHLRMCLECGHIGCCDSSPGQHATAHFRDTGHAVMRSIEPGEDWRWCYVDSELQQ